MYEYNLTSCPEIFFSTGREDPKIKRRMEADAGGLSGSI
jgi:hypothetical protein